MNTERRQEDTEKEKTFYKESMSPLELAGLIPIFVCELVVMYLIQNFCPQKTYWLFIGVCLLFLSVVLFFIAIYMYCRFVRKKRKDDDIK